MIGIILAAGRGSRLKKMTRDIPKCLLKFKNKTILERIVENFLLNGIQEIYIVTGYKSKKIINQNIKKKIFNKRWNTTSILSSLICCNKLLLKNECIISYADIIYDYKCIKDLKSSKSEVSILSNTNWKSLWKKRFANPLSDLESFRLKNNILVDIGNKVRSLHFIQGQFMGLLKIKPNGWKKIINHRRNFYKNYTNKIDITTFLKSYINAKRNKVFVKKTKHFWYEIDFIKDYKFAKKEIKL